MGVWSSIGPSEIESCERSMGLFPERHRRWSTLALFALNEYEPRNRPLAADPALPVLGLRA
jgi:hypothetical protein